MAKGLRFFGTDFNNIAFGGGVTASSSTSLQEFAFDGQVSTRWTSSGENTDGDSIHLTMDYGINRLIDSVFVYNTNIDDISIEYWNGSAWVEFEDGVNATVIKSSDGAYVFAKLTTAVSTQSVRILGSNTIVADQEKYVGMFLAFLEIGQFEYFPDFDADFEPEQNIYKTTNGLSFVIERGEVFTADITMRSHVNQNDIDLFMTLVERKEPFFIWPNGGDESIFAYSFKPYRFRDIFKVSIIGKYSPKLTRNYYKAGLNAKIKIAEVV